MRGALERDGAAMRGAGLLERDGADIRGAGLLERDGADIRGLLVRAGGDALVELQRPVPGDISPLLFEPDPRLTAGVGFVLEPDLGEVLGFCVLGVLAGFCMVGFVGFPAPGPLVLFSLGAVALPPLVLDAA